VLLNASGCLDALTAPETARQLDAFVTKTVTPERRAGNPPPRIAETESGMLNAIGLANPGREAFAAELLPRLRELGVPIWVSVGGFNALDYAETCARLAGDDVACIELNLSCPNVDEAPETAAEIVAACRAATSLPLFAKLSPHAWDVGETVRAVEDAGADGLSLVNTLRGCVLDRALSPVLARGTGGYSGPALKPVALAAVLARAARDGPAHRRHGRRGHGAGRARADRLRRHVCRRGDGALLRSERTEANPGRARGRGGEGRVRTAGTSLLHRTPERCPSRQLIVCWGCTRLAGW
jgi:dihydroorotate dehydrogenase